MNVITYQKLNQDFLHQDILNDFNRYQEVRKCWRKQNNEWVLIDNPFVENWDLNKKHYIVSEMVKCISNHGIAYGATAGNRLIGFACISNEFFGNNNEYINLISIQVSAEYRKQGIGKHLFELISSSARQLGAGKLYISAHSSEESQAFYRSIGCVDAAEINQSIADEEPFDCQLEFVL